MRKSLPLALLLTLTSTFAVSGAVTTAPDRYWDLQQQLKDVQSQIDGLHAQITQLQTQNATLQTENADLKTKLSQTQDQLRAAATQPIRLTPEALNPPDMLKDYPQDKMPLFGDPSNPLRIRALNDFLNKKYGGKPVIITGKFQSTNGSTDRGFTVLLATPDPATPPRWNANATFPITATDDILHFKKDDSLTLTGTITRVIYNVPNAKTTLLSIFLKDATLPK